MDLFDFFRGNAHNGFQRKGEGKRQCTEDERGSWATDWKAQGGTSETAGSIAGWNLWETVPDWSTQRVSDAVLILNIYKLPSNQIKIFVLHYWITDQTFSGKIWWE